MRPHMLSAHGQNSTVLAKTRFESVNTVASVLSTQHGRHWGSLGVARKDGATGAHSVNTEDGKGYIIHPGNDK